MVLIGIFYRTAVLRASGSRSLPGNAAGVNISDSRLNENLWLLLMIGQGQALPLQKTATEGHLAVALDDRARHAVPGIVLLSHGLQFVVWLDEIYFSRHMVGLLRYKIRVVK